MSFVLRDAEKIVCAVILLAMTLLGFANVVVRYLTNYSLAATEELLTLLPPRKVPPKSEPPLRRIARARAVT